MVAPITANGDTLDIVHLMRPNLHNALTTSSATSPRGAAATAAAAAAAGGGSPTASNAIADRPATARARLEGGGRHWADCESETGEIASREVPRHALRPRLWWRPAQQRWQ
eukprot:COSAG06_NODE_5997_length_3162_cov_99.799543_3_plen_111_part_00